MLCYITFSYCLCRLCIQMLRLQHRQKLLSKWFPLQHFLIYLYRHR
nr:MAG TPA: hypothetical protein [Bacteriophage sp.]DAZ75740.1 MAG TPA: hypothetical protein [Caudoviricetes sp.]